MNKRVHVTLGPLFPLFVRARNARDLKYSKAAEVMPSCNSVLLVTVFFATLLSFLQIDMCTVDLHYSGKIVK